MFHTLFFEFTHKHQGISEEIWNQLTQAAQTHDKYALLCMGYCYLYGFGVAKNERQALEYFLQAGELGVGLAYWEVGFCYKKGSGILKDHAKAFHYTQCAIDLGVSAQDVLSTFYEHGRAVDKNENRALELLELGVKQKNPFAYLKLGQCFENGTLSIAKNLKHAMTCYLLASRENITAAYWLTGRQWQWRAETDLENKLAFFFFAHAAVQGDASGQYLGWVLHSENIII